MRQTGRYELKFVVDEQRAVAIADFVRTYLRPSPHNQSGPIPGHPVISLYMDSPDYFFYRQGFTGHKNRIKLRIRFYDNEWKRPAFLEIKRRNNDVICKDRAMISREAVRQFLTCGWPSPSYWPDPADLMHGKRRLDVYEDFWRIANTIHARGIMYVSYVREIFEAPDDDELRVTFDRHVHGTLYDGSGRLGVPATGFSPPSDEPPYHLPRDGVILEMKFDERAPMWMYDLVRCFNLRRQAMCKYNALVERIGLHFGNRLLPEYEEPLVAATWTC